VRLPHVRLSSSRLKVVFASVVLALLGAAALVAFSAYGYDETHWLLFLMALAIGTAVGLVADHRQRSGLDATIAAVAAWACGVSGHAAIALLEGRATAAEFTIDDLNRRDFFVALEAYRISEARRPTGRAFTGATRRQDYDDATWQAASAAWAGKPAAEKGAIERHWRGDYERLHESMGARLGEVIFSPAYLWVYAIGALIAGGVVIAFAHER